MKGREVLFNMLLYPPLPEKMSLYIFQGQESVRFKRILAVITGGEKPSIELVIYKMI